MVHNGLDKLADPEGFAEFVVSEHLDFLPDALSPEQWTIGATGVEIIAPVFLAIGLLPRLSALSYSGRCLWRSHSRPRDGIGGVFRSASSRRISTRSKPLRCTQPCILSLPRGTGRSSR